MNYYELIHRIKDTARTDDDASQDALELVVENVAAHLTDHTRREFAAALPDELQSAAQMVPTANHIDEDIIEQLMELEDVDETSAKVFVKPSGDVADPSLSTSVTLMSVIVHLLTAAAARSA